MEAATSPVQNGDDAQPVALVIGGGIGGLSAALALHEAGFAVHVFEQARRLAEVGAGINLLPAATAVLHGLGLEAALQDTGGNGGDGIHTTELVYCAPSGTVILREKRGVAAGNDTPQYSIHRGWLHRALLNAVIARVGEDHVHTGHSFRSFEQDAGAVTAHFHVLSADDSGSNTAPSNATYHGSLLIGADGIRSAVRKQLLPEEQAVYTGWRIYRGVVEVDTQCYDGCSMLLYGTGKVAAVLYPISERARQGGKTLLNWGINCNDSVLAPELQGTPGEESWTRRVSKDEFQHLVGSWVFPKECFPDRSINFASFIDATPDASVTCYALFDRDPVQQWTFGRVSLLGDAAHPLLPFGSQGAGQALLDVAALKKVCADAGGAKGDVPSMLLAYEKARVEQAGKVVLTNRNMGPTRLLKMFEDAVGDKTTEEQERWVASNEQTIVDFSKNYQSMTGLFSTASAGASP